MALPSSTRGLRAARPHRATSGGGVFAGVLSARPYPAPRLSDRDWANIPPRQVRLDELTTTKAELRLDKLLADNSTFFGDLFCHVVDWQGALYLEDGLHRAVQAALQHRTTLHVRVARIDAEGYATNLTCR